MTLISYFKADFRYSADLLKNPILLSGWRYKLCRNERSFNRSFNYKNSRTSKFSRSQANALGYKFRESKLTKMLILLRLVLDNKNKTLQSGLSSVAQQLTNFGSLRARNDDRDANGKPIISLLLLWYFCGIGTTGNQRLIFNIAQDLANGTSGMDYSGLSAISSVYGGAIANQLLQAVQKINPT